MSREQYKTPDEEIAEEFGRVLELFQQARSKFLFAPLMNEASAKGLNWVQALEYVTGGEKAAQQQGAGAL